MSSLEFFQLAYMTSQAQEVNHFTTLSSGIFCRLSFLRPIKRINSILPFLEHTLAQIKISQNIHVLEQNPYYSINGHVLHQNQPILAQKISLI